MRARDPTVVGRAGASCREARASQPDGAAPAHFQTASSVDDSLPIHAGCWARSPAPRPVGIAHMATRTVDNVLRRPSTLHIAFCTYAEPMGLYRARS